MIKLKITGILLVLVGAVITSALPLPGNLIGIPIAAVGILIIIVPTPGRDWRNL